MLFRILQKIGVGPGAHRFKHGLIVVQRGQHQDLGVGKRPGDFAGGGDAALDGHVQIHQDDIGMKRFGELHGFHAVAGLAHHFHVRFHGQQQRGAAAHQRLIFRNDDPDGGNARRLRAIHRDNRHCRSLRNSSVK